MVAARTPPIRAATWSRRGESALTDPEVGSWYTRRACLVRDESRKGRPWLMETMHGLGTEREPVVRYTAARVGAKSRLTFRLAASLVLAAAVGLAFGAFGTWLLLRR
jgi:hypothetical protein